MSRIKVAVLGCGPAGMLAAHAAARENCDVDIFSEINKSRIGGAQYLYIPIPGITGRKPDGRCMVSKVGSRFGYARRVYGDPHAPTSWDNFQDGQIVPIWNLRKAYETLWDIYGYSIIDTQITPNWLLTQGGVYEEYDVVISCIPRKALCITGQHEFRAQDVWVQQGESQDDTHWIEYNGTEFDDMPWYRSSQLFGVKGYEYSKPPEADGTLQISKPLHHNCDCWAKATKMHFMGRYGQWRKDQLTHHAYVGTLEVVNYVKH